MEPERYFKKFLEEMENADLKRKIQTYTSNLEIGANLMYLKCLKTVVIDAAANVNFSSATCAVEEMELQDEDDLVAIGCFFATECKY